MRGLIGGWASVVMALSGCGDETPARDVSDGEVTGEVGPDVDDTSDAVEDVDAEPDGVDPGDASDASEEIDVPSDVTPEQAAILAVPESARFEVPGLTGPVHVVRTEGSTPHVYAADRDDLARVLGFVQARDRFFFMDLQRRLGLGRIAELLGDLGLASDAESRGTGMAYVTDRIVQHISPEFSAYLSAFAEGVNAYIDAVRDERLPAPTETQYSGVLGYASPAEMMKPFTLRDVVALAVVFMYSTNFETGDVGLAAAAERLDGLFAGAADEALRKAGYLADVWSDVRPIFPGTNSTEGFGVGKAARAHAPRAEARGGAEPRLPEGMAQRLFDKLRARERRLGKDREAGFGSNVWAVAGDKTADGAALLANDGHLELTVPPLGYGAAIDTRVFGGGDLHQLGGWLGNFPVMVGGTNGDVAWGGVNPVLDITDWYREEIALDAAGRPAHSRFKGEWRALAATDESYVIADVPLLGSVGRTETWTRWETFDGRWITSVEGRPAASADDHGEGEVVVNLLGDLVVPKDMDGDGVITALAFDHAALDATRWPEALFEVGLGQSVADVREATRGYVGSALFTGAADGAGSILYTSYQAVPCRGYLPRGQDGVFIAGADPTRIIDGTEYGGFTLPTDAAGKADEGPGANDPQRCVVPFSQMPHAIDPPSGFVFNANNDPAGLTDDGEERNDAWHLGGVWASVRANTIRRDLLGVTAGGQATIDDMVAMQANVQSRLGEVFADPLGGAIERAMGATEGPLAALWAEHGERLAEAGTRMGAWGLRGFWARSGVETFYHSPSADERDDAVATMIFNAWVRRFIAAVWDDEGIDAWRWGGEARIAALLRFLAGRGPDNPGALTSWNPATGESVFFDRLGTPALETSDELMLRALVDALAYLESGTAGAASGGFGTADMDAWLWGLRHQVRFESILGSYVGDDPALSLITADFSITTERIPLMPSLPAGDPRKSLKWFPRPGDQWSVDAANPGLGVGEDFTHGSGPAMRLVFALKDGQVQGRFILPGGQSALVDSPHFDDQVRLWLANDYYTVRFAPADVAAGAIGREVYVPAP